MTRNMIIGVTNFLVYVTLQVLVFQNLVVFDVGFVFVYIIFLLLLPMELSFSGIMLLGFATGTIVDVFYNTLGIHASACVLLAFVRPYWTRLVTPRSGYEVGVLPTLNSFGLGWFITYALPLIFIHHSTVFIIEAGGINFLSMSLLKGLASSILSLVFIVAIQYLFFKNQR